MEANNFQFKLTPEYWVLDGDEEQVFRALELADGRYLVTWNNDDGFQNECFYTAEEIMTELLGQAWLIIEE